MYTAVPAEAQRRRLVGWRATEARVASSMKDQSGRRLGSLLLLGAMIESRMCITSDCSEVVSESVDRERERRGGERGRQFGSLTIEASPIVQVAWGKRARRGAVRGEGGWKGRGWGWGWGRPLCFLLKSSAGGTQGPSLTRW
jgi:hypothetical protein